MTLGLALAASLGASGSRGSGRDNSRRDKAGRRSTTRTSTARSSAAGEGAVRRAASSSGATARVSRGGVDTAAGIVVSGGAGRAGVVGSGVDTNGDPGQDALRNVVTEENILDERVVVIGGLAESNVIGRVKSQLLLVGAVRGDGLNFGNEGLIEEELADMVGGTVDIGIVVEDGSAGSALDVNVSSTASVMTREHCIKLNDTIVIGLLNTATEGGVKTTLAGGGDTGVDAGSVAVPSVDQDLGHSSTGSDIDKLDIEMQRHTRLAIGHLAADELASNPVGTNSGLRHDDTASVLSEEGSRVGIQSVSR